MGFLHLTVGATLSAGVEGAGDGGHLADLRWFYEGNVDAQYRVTYPSNGLRPVGVDGVFVVGRPWV